MVLSPPSYTRTIVVGIAVLVLSVLLMELATIPAIVIDPSIIAFEPDTSRLAIMLFLPLNFIGLALGGFIYLRLTNRSWEWLDLKRPDKQDVIWIVAGSIVALVILFVGGIVAHITETDVPPSPLMEMLQADVLLLGFMLLTVWLFNAPAEELVFRNVIQKRAYAAFSGVGAVLFASILFALIHIPGYLALGADLESVIVPATVIFLGSIVMGLGYLRTKNLIVPICIHAIFNSFQIGILLIATLLGIDVDQGTGAVLVLR